MHKDNKPVLSIGFVAVLAAAVLISAGLYFVSRGATGTPANLAAAEKSSPSTGSVWQDLKLRGLQGEHYTLNIHGKKSDFNKSDCTVAVDPITGQYSNNIFVPSYSDDSANNQIIMTSGNAKGKFASTNPVYGVRDACTAPFDGDAAELVLPPNEKGYYVAARVLGKPTDNPSLTLEGSLMWVKDENGNDLLVLGLVTDNGFQTPTGTLTRQAGKTRATDITGLFEWNGSVCYFNPTSYCYDPDGTYMCTPSQTCCQDSNADGIYESCSSPTTGLDGSILCPVGYSLFNVECKDYLNEWVFNIGDFVGYMWDTYTDGDFKLANIRFYPVR